MLNNIIINVSFVFFVSFISSYVIIFRHAQKASSVFKRNDTDAIQASHSTPVSRLGGLSIIIALVFAALPIIDSTSSWPNYWLLLLSTFPVFVVGFCEDLGYFSSPRIRLLAAVLSGVSFICLFGFWLTRTDIPGLDLVIRWAPIGIGFSLFLATGINHAFNLIDGLNGLSSFTSIGIALSLAVISHQVELFQYQDFLIILSAAIAGFVVLNFPFGKIFLGDGGAYAIGHILVWVSISILYAAPSVTPLSILLIFFFPIVDTLIAIVRRIYLGEPILRPDRLHFHQLIMRGVEILFLGRNRLHIANPLATLLTLPFAFTPMIVGVLVAFDRSQAAIACLFFFVFYAIIYMAIILLTRRFWCSI
ncbi:glycosyltransferase [Amylibacter sp.]|nr:glycosyltransferase [Amylibacter sp.]